MRKLLFTISLLICGVSALSAETETEKPKFNRGIERATSCFIPKGTLGAGVSFAYNNFNIGNSHGDSGYALLFSVVKDVNAYMQTWSVSPYASYFIRDNLALGARFNYGRTSLSLGGANLALSESMSFGISDYNYFKQAYEGALTARYYMAIANSKRFGMFVELRATGGYGQSETYRWQEILTPGSNLPTGEYEKVGTYQDLYNFEIGLVPGLAVFVTNEVALEVSVGVLGLSYEKAVQTTNQVNVSVMENSGANFKINLFSIGLGLSYYIPVKSSKIKKS